MKIKYKFTAIIFFVIALVSVANYQLFTRTFETIQTRRLETAEAVLSNSLAATLVRPLIERQQDQITAKLMQEMLLSDDKVSYLIVFDDKNKIFAHTFLSDIPNTVYTLNNTFKEGEINRIDHMETSELQSYNIAAPINEGIQQVGTLHVGISKTFIEETASPLKKATESLVLSAILISGVGLLMAMLASYTLTRSLTRLKDWALQLSNGDFTADIDINSRDEIASLVQAFKDMRSKVQLAHDKLAEQNQNLESIISKRTAELENNHQKLLKNNVQLEKLANDLEQERKNLKIVFSAMDYPLIVVNRDYSIAMMNDKAEELSGIQQLNSVQCFEAAYNFSNNCRSDSTLCPMKEIIKTKKPLTMEHQYDNADREAVIIEIRAFPIFDDQGEIVQIVESFFDITEKKHAEQENLLLERELNRAAKMESIGTLAAGIAHEINTPIQFIGDNTDFTSDSIKDLFEIIQQYKTLLNEFTAEHNEIQKRIKRIDEDGDLEYITEELPTALDQTKDGIKHVTEIVKAMKDFSHLSSDEKMGPANINEAIETTLTISKNEWKYEADLIRNLDPQLPKAQCQLGEIKQVLLNLIVNAAHAIAERRLNEQSTAKGTIEISTSRSEGCIQVAIADTGTGIAEEHKSRIFDHFFTTKEVGKGTGQGLSMAYQIIVEIHGGKLWFESEQGKGTTFYFTLKTS